MQYRKKPVIIDAMQFETNNESGTKNMDDIVSWINESEEKDRGIMVKAGPHAYHNGTDIFIPTLEGVMTAQCRDWIIKGIKGEFYPCKPDIFEATYEKV